MTARHYAGIGSRETPIEIQTAMTEMSRQLAEQGFILRSGGAPGADMAFEKGVTDPRMKQIYIPWNGFQARYHGRYGAILPSDAVYPHLMNEAHAAMGDEHWARCGQGAQRLHGRNVCQMRGLPTLTNSATNPILWPEPSEFAICWTRGGMLTGGTSTGIKIASAHNIPLVNMGCRNWDQKIRELASSKGFHLDL